MFRLRAQIELLLRHEGALRSYRLPTPVPFRKDISPGIVPAGVFAFVGAFFVVATGYDSCIPQDPHLHVAQGYGLELIIARFEICQSLSLGYGARRTLAYRAPFASTVLQRCLFHRPWVLPVCRPSGPVQMLPLPQPAQLLQIFASSSSPPESLYFLSRTADCFQVTMGKARPVRGCSQQSRIKFFCLFWKSVARVSSPPRQSMAKRTQRSSRRKVCSENTRLSS